jgi:signal transduction histidine kinase
LKCNKSLILIAVFFAVASLIVAAAAEFIWADNNAAVRTGIGLVRIAAYIISALSIIWLGRFAYQLYDSVTSIARHLNNDGLTQFKSTSNQLVNELAQAIYQCLNVKTDSLEQMRDRLKQLQIKAQLSETQKKNTEAIIYSLRDAVIVVDDFNKLLMANEPAGKLFGFDYQSIQRRYFTYV